MRNTAEQMVEKLTKELIRIITNEIIAEKEVNNNITMTNQQINDLVIDIVEKINLTKIK